MGQVSYTNDGQLAGLTLGGSGPKAQAPTNTLFSTADSYDSIQRPLSESATMTGQSQPFFSQSRSYDNIGNVLTLDTVIPSQSGGTLVDNQSYCYDDLSRLVTPCHAKRHQRPQIPHQRLVRQHRCRRQE